MGLTRTEASILVELRSKINEANTNKQKLLNYVEKIKNKYENQEITYSEYEKLINKKINNKSVQEWLTTYDNYIKGYSEQIKNINTKAYAKKIFSVFLLFLFGFFVLISLFYFRTTIIGFVVQEPAQEYTENLNFKFTSSSTYEWIPKNQGQLNSIKISGLINGEGEVRVYLDDLLILDSTNLQQSSGFLTGRVVEETESAPTPSEPSSSETTSESSPSETPPSPSPEESYSEEQEAQQPSEQSEEPADSSQPQELPVPDTIEEITEEEELIEEDIEEEVIEEPEEQTEIIGEINETEEETVENITLPGENITEIVEPEENVSVIEPEENITLPEENVTEVVEPEANASIVEPAEEEITINFNDICEETCDSLKLNKSSYNLRIELLNSNITIRQIKYEIIGEEIINITENITEINETNVSFINTSSSQIIIGQPVKWTKQVKLDKPGKVKVELPKQAEDITVNKIIGKIKEKVEEESYSEEQEAQQPSEQSEEPADSSQPQELPVSDIIKEQASFTSSVITGEVTAETESRGFFSRIFSITGRAVTTEETPESIEVIIEDSATEYEIEYYTEAPQAFEVNMSESKKQVIISGPDDLNYENVLAYTSLNSEAVPEAVKLYHMTENGKIEVETEKYDTNNNGLVDYISWNVPHLSEQTYELEIIILNVKSHPQTGKNWTVYFNTTGMANLTITAVNITNWSNTNEEHDLKFLEIKCGEETLEYEWIDNGPDNSSVFIENYECNETASEISKALTTGFHYIEFDFGGIKAYAYNTAGNLNLQITGSINSYTESVWLKTLDDATEGFDAYDMESSPPPSNYAELFSNISGYNLVIDSWNDSSNPRTLYLTYRLDAIAGPQTGTMDFSWNSINDTNYTGIFTYYEDDATYSTPVGSVDMREITAYQDSVTSEQYLYAKVEMIEFIDLIINLTYPSNTTYSSTTLDLKYTFNNSNLDSCWYSLNLGATNSSRQNCGTNWTGLSASEGTNTWMVYINDSEGNQNYSSRTFTVDTNVPSVTLNSVYHDSTSPYNISNSTPTAYAFTNENASCRASVDGDESFDQMIEDITCAGNGTNHTCYFGSVSEGDYTISVACIDPSGNNNSAGNNDDGLLEMDVSTPVQSGHDPANESIIGYTSTIIDFDIDEVGDCKWSLTDQAYQDMAGDCTGDGTTSHSCDIVGMIEGEEIVYIACRDDTEYYSNNDTAGTNTELTYTIDTSPPLVSIIYPSSITYNENIQFLNYSYSDLNPDSCWYSINGGTANSSRVDAGVNFTSVSSSEGGNTWILYCNDTTNNENSSSVTFTRDTIPPEITINSPTNTTYDASEVSFNISSNEALSSCLFTINNWVTNYTMTLNSSSTGATYTNNSMADGSFLSQFYCNDSIGNINNTETKAFSVDTNDVPNTPTVYINSTDGSNKTLQNLNCRATITDPNLDNLNATVEWYKEDTFNLSMDYNNSYDSGTNFNATFFYTNTTKGDNWSCGIRLHDGTDYSSWINSSKLQILNTQPEIINVSNKSIGLDMEEDNFTEIIINFSVYDPDTYSDLDDSTARINMTFNETEEDRINNSCLAYEQSGNYVNYTCNITMWWWDLGGNWTLEAYVEDTSGVATFNNTVTQEVGNTTSFIINPSLLTWLGASPGATNLTSNNDPIVLNNLGNVPITNITINTTNLRGEQDNNKALWAGNFSAGINTGANEECGASFMRLGLFTQIQSAILPRGNYTIGDGTGEEEIYFCLTVIGSDLTVPQAYSTAEEGSWTISIVQSLAVLALARRKKKKKKRKKKENNRLQVIELKEQEIPITIFTKQLGGLEAVVKYMKENLQLTYKEISELIHRDQRTVWSSYNKAREKMPEKLVDKSKITIKISIFSEKLTILETVIINLRQKQLKNKQIAELLNRDERNIWAIYSRTKEKLEEFNIKEPETQLVKEKLSIPLSIFIKQLGGLEAVVKYMKENLQLTYKEISELIHRDQRTVWSSYNKAREKMPEKLEIKKTDKIPLDIFTHNLTILEAAITYLKKQQLMYSEIGALLQRDERNIWTIYSRAVKKTKK